jgi:hypothetical protein
VVSKRYAVAVPEFLGCIFLFLRVLLGRNRKGNINNPPVSHSINVDTMSIKQRRPSATNLHHIPSTSFSTFSSAASATSVGTSRSGGSRLLFGEIDLTSDRCTYTSFLLASSIVNDLTRNLQPPRPSRLSAAWCCQIAALSSNSG